MSRRLARFGLFLAMAVATLVAYSIAAWSWGSWSGFLAHPARAGLCVVGVLATVAMAFTEVNLRGVRQSDTRSRWMLGTVAAIGVLLFVLPPYTDSRDVLVLDGDLVRYTGLVVYIVGCVLRVGPMFALGERFRWPLAIQDEHRLVTTGFYRYVRHPSYLGFLLMIVGWALVFRSVIGVALALVPALFAKVAIAAEEAILLQEFGDRYAEYQRRTWRVVPFVY
jgi:protein-S-isoprenylcysteine O-methyltransferase Ste14